MHRLCEYLGVKSTQRYTLVLVRCNIVTCFPQLFSGVLVTVQQNRGVTPLIDLITRTQDDLQMEIQARMMMTMPLQENVCFVYCTSSMFI